jgi:hypothetical protein
MGRLIRVARERISARLNARLKAEQSEIVRQYTGVPAIQETTPAKHVPTKLKNPPPQQSETKRESWAEKALRQFAEDEQARLTILRRAEKFADEFPAQREQIMRQARMRIEALKDRKDRT